MKSADLDQQGFLMSMTLVSTKNNFLISEAVSCRFFDDNAITGLAFVAGTKLQSRPYLEKLFKQGFFSKS